MVSPSYAALSARLESHKWTWVRETWKSPGEPCILVRCLDKTLYHERNHGQLVAACQDLLKSLGATAC